MNIGFVGLGAMGRPIVVNLIDLGHELVVCDTDETRTAILAQRGATVAGSAREVADTADVVLACMPNLDAAEAVAILKQVYQSSFTKSWMLHALG